MRETKFRVWDGKRMTNQIELRFAHGLRLVSTSDLGFGIIGDDKCVLMQYTGLKDKNGKEVYEGDIVRYSNKSDREVVFEKGMFQSRQKNGWGALVLIANNCEVIGNIYENPELLTI